jgi:hypothetical protein
MKTWLVPVLCGALALAACKKDSSGSGDSKGVPGVPKPVAVDTSKLHVPALFASIPSDTPFVMASFEATPLEYWAKVRDAFGPLYSGMFTKLRASGGDKPGTRVIDAVFAELEGKWNAKGLESLGLSATPRFAIYGLGLSPVVFRIEIKDAKVLLATIERVAQKAAVTLPPATPAGAGSYWQFDEAGVRGIVAVTADNQFVFAAGSTDGVAAKLPLILGTEKPASNMADGKALMALMTQYGFGPYILGYADTKQLGHKIAEHFRPDLPPACGSEIDRLATRVPRIILGYTELTANRVAGAFVVELASDLQAEVAALRTNVPGLGEALAGDPLFAMGMAADLAGAKKLGQAMAGALASLGGACDAMAMAEAGASMDRTMSAPLPPPLDQITGGAMSLQSLSMQGGSPMPDAVDAIIVVAAKSGKGLFDAAKAAAPPIAQLGIEADGSLHKLSIPMHLPFDVFAGVGDHAIVVAAGDKSKHAADEVMKASGGGKTPLAVMSYDLGRFMELQAKLGGGGMFSPQGMGNVDFSKLGRATMSVDVDGHGLAMWVTFDLK